MIPTLCFDGKDPQPCEMCGVTTSVVINGLGYCQVHLEEGIGVIVRLEVLRVGAPSFVAEEATKWLLAQVRTELALRQ
jgi:hypothetical protein